MNTEITQVPENLPLPLEFAQWVQKEVSKLPQYQPLTAHYFADGMYCRVVYRDAGVVTVGKVHKREHFYMVVAGGVRVTTDNGVKDLWAPAVIVCSPGTKRVVVSLADSVCVTVHRTDKRDIAEIEEELMEDDPTSMYGPGNILKTENQT